MQLRALTPYAAHIHGGPFIALGDGTPIAYVDTTGSSIWTAIPIPSGIHKVAVHKQRYTTHGADHVHGDAYEIVSV